MEDLICSYCGERLQNESAVYVGDDILCESCAEEHTVRCERCGAALYSEDNSGTDSFPLCADCFESHYQQCTRCHALLANSEVYYAEDDEDEPLCYSCYQQEEEQRHSIRPYTYKPEPIFYGQGDRFYGVELEIDDGGKSESNAKELLNIANRDGEDRLYIKIDGSLESGLELVTHPMTLQYHLDNMPWLELTEKAVNMGYRSHRTTTCGLHIHQNRSSLERNEEEQEVTISKILFFFEKHWDELLIFSRRTQTQLDRWAARYGYKDHPREVLDQAKKSRRGRYACINLLNRDTIEYRIFRGTLKRDTLIAALELVDSISDAALFLSEEEMKSLSWQAFVKDIDPRKKPELISYLKAKQLYVNEPVAEEADF